MGEVEEAAGPWVPVVMFSPEAGSPFVGELGIPVASFLNASEALDVAVAADALIAWASAMKIRAVARLAEAIGEEDYGRRDCQPVRFKGEEAHALAVAEVATSTAVSERAAARLVHDAEDLCGPQWETLDALEDGKISPAHASVILEAARSVPAESASSFARAALRRATTRGGRRRTPGELRTCLRKLRERLHPETLRARKKAAGRERGVWFAPEPDGMCTLTAFLPAEAGLAIYTGLDHDARTVKAHTVKARGGDAHGAAEPSAAESPAATAAAEERTLSQLRADALTQRLLGGTEPLGPGAGLFRPEVLLTIPVGLLPEDVDSRVGPDGGGIASPAGRPAAELPPAELEGYGPIDPATARRLAALAPAWHPVYTDAATGRALGVGRKAYRPSQALRRYLAHRDGGCIFPACTIPPPRCEPDHTIEWQDGGTTDPSNLALLCTKHHALKSLGAWTYRIRVALDLGPHPHHRTLRPRHIAPAPPQET